MPEGAGITDMIIAQDGSVIATCASYNWPGGQSGGIRRSTNGGDSWQNINSVYNARTLWLGSTGKIFASYWPYPQNESMYYSTNNGLNWVQMYFGSANDNVFSIASKNSDSVVFIGTRYGVWRCINNGLWQFTSTGIPPNTFVYDLDVDLTGNYIAAGTSKGLYVSSNNGANWNAVSGVPQSDTIYTVCFMNTTTESGSDNLLFAGSSGGELYKSDDVSQFHMAVLILTFLGRISELEVVEYYEDREIAAGIAPVGSDNSIGTGFAYSTDKGATWIENQNGLPSGPKVSAITYQVTGGNIQWYLGLFENTTNGAKVYKMTTPIGIQTISSEIPENYSLSQNYPNPFNPSTKIKFEIARPADVSIIVFDILGRHITTLVNEKLSAGTYETEWNAVNMPGGIYFYRLETEDFSETNKMVLVK